MQATSLCLNQWWPCLMTHVCIIGLCWVRHWYLFITSVNSKVCMTVTFYPSLYIQFRIRDVINQLSLVEAFQFAPFQLRPNSSKYTSVRRSIRPSVTPFSQCSSHRIAMEFYYHWQTRCPCERTRSDVKCQGHNSQRKFASIWAFPDRNSNLNTPMEWCRKLKVA